MRTAYQLMAGLALAQNQPADAIRAAEQELAMDAELLKQDERNASARRNQALAYMQIARAHEQRKDARTASSWYRKSVAGWNRARADGILIPAYVKRAEEASQGLARCENLKSGKRQ
jgi:hypothetical protein